jgi:DNA-binding transcriptional MerR regulator
MEYRIEELASVAGVRVDTIRFYQGKGLIPAPQRRGRVAIYDDRHLERLRRIRELLDQGFRLAQIARLTDAETAPAQSGSQDLLQALARESVGGRTLSRSELASEAGVPEVLINAVAQAGLIEPVIVEGQERFTEADLEMARAGLAILGQGFPLDALLTLAVQHARHVQEVADGGIDLFDEHARKQPDARPDAIVEAFHTLLPHVTRLVALHFQRTLVNRALERLRSSGESTALQQALAATETSRLEISWR